MGGQGAGHARLPLVGASASMPRMPLFDPPVVPALLWPIEATWPKRRARTLLKQFQERWPELSYDVDLAVDVVNAQAFLDQGVRRIHLYGGLVRHRHVGRAGLVVTLAHETGHHLGGPPYHDSYRWLSSEAQANRWAQTVGLVSLFGSVAAQRIWRTGTAQLAGIAS